MIITMKQIHIITTHTRNIEAMSFEGEEQMSRRLRKWEEIDNEKSTSTNQQINIHWMESVYRQKNVCI